MDRYRKLKSKEEISGINSNSLGNENDDADKIYTSQLKQYQFDERDMTNSKGNHFSLFS